MAMAGGGAVAAAKRCMNPACGGPASSVVGAGGDWRKGWPLRSGGFALLCDKCGLAYEQFVFCDIFHQKESGWRDCSFCGKVRWRPKPQIHANSTMRSSAVKCLVESLVSSDFVTGRSSGPPASDKYTMRSTAEESILQILGLNCSATVFL